MAITLFADGRIEKNGTNVLGFTPAFSAYTSSNFDIATGTYVKVLYQTELFDTDGAYDASTSVFTVPAGKGGAYQINATTAVDDINDQTYVSISLGVNGATGDSTGFYRMFDYSPQDNRIITMGFSCIKQLSAGDEVNIWVYHNSTGTQVSENYCNSFSMFRIGGI